uniref:Uncharacterized protein n=1 Tax=Chrysotila carterae TaxID=13221 RepID=A0A7S4C096_CHRCT
MTLSRCKKAANGTALRLTRLLRAARSVERLLQLHGQNAAKFEPVHIWTSWMTLAELLRRQKGLRDINFVQLSSLRLDTQKRASTLNPVGVAITSHSLAKMGVGGEHPWSEENDECQTCVTASRQREVKPKLLRMTSA